MLPKGSQRDLAGRRRAGGSEAFAAYGASADRPRVAREGEAVRMRQHITSRHTAALIARGDTISQRRASYNGRGGGKEAVCTVDGPDSPWDRSFKACHLHSLRGPAT